MGAGNIPVVNGSVSIYYNRYNTFVSGVLINAIACAATGFLQWVYNGQLFLILSCVCEFILGIGTAMSLYCHTSHDNSVFGKRWKDHSMGWSVTQVSTWCRRYAKDQRLFQKNDIIYVVSYVFSRIQSNCSKFPPRLSFFGLQITTSRVPILQMTIHWHFLELSLNFL